MVGNTRQQKPMVRNTRLQKATASWYRNQWATKTNVRNTRLQKATLGNIMV